MLLVVKSQSRCTQLLVACACCLCLLLVLVACLLMCSTCIFSLARQEELKSKLLVEGEIYRKYRFFHFSGFRTKYSGVSIFLRPEAFSFVCCV